MPCLLHYAAQGVFYYTPGTDNNTFVVTPMASAALDPQVFKIAGALTSINTTYILNTNPMMFDDAQAYCNKMGGHLVSYGSSQVRPAAPALPGSPTP
jgi:hypothetical protein